MNRSQVLAAATMAVVLGAFGTGTTWAINTHTQQPYTVGHYVTPTAQATAYAASEGATVIYEKNLVCGEALTDQTQQIAGCYRWGTELFIATGLGAHTTAWTIYHELGHYLSNRDGLNWTETDCDLYANQMVG